MYYTYPYTCFLYICFYRIARVYWNQTISVNSSYLISYALSENMLWGLDGKRKEHKSQFLHRYMACLQLFLAWILWVYTKQFIPNTSNLLAIMCVVNLYYLAFPVKNVIFCVFLKIDLMTNILQIRFSYISSPSYAQFNLSKPHIVEDIWYWA